jgi:hypothetical protein
MAHGSASLRWRFDHRHVRRLGIRCKSAVMEPTEVNANCFALVRGDDIKLDTV